MHDRVETGACGRLQGALAAVARHADEDGHYCFAVPL
jgi:hypothetical protein